MSDSLVIIEDRAGELHLFDPESISHTDDLHPIMIAAAAVINAGYEGIAVTEGRLKNGRYLQALEVNFATPEGIIFRKLNAIMAGGGVLPTCHEILAAIHQAYEA